MSFSSVLSFQGFLVSESLFKSRMNCINFSSNILQAIGTRAKTEHALFNLLHDSRRKIILLGIQQQTIDQPYRRSRAGTKLFHKINSIISNCIPQSKPKSSICNKNLIFIGYNGSSKTNNLNLSYINAWSIVNKIDPYQMELNDSNVDICAITETGLKIDDDLTMKMVPPPNYNIHSTPRTTGKQGRGLALVYKNHINVTHKGNYNKETMECSEYLLKTAQLLVDLYVIYCMPSTNVLTFCNDLANLTELNITKNRGKLLLVSDCNIHLDEPAHSDTILFNDTLESLDLQNMVKSPIHRSGHILDVIITECNSPLVSSVHIGHQFSDHKFIHTVSSTTKPVPVEMTVKYQKIKNISIDKFGSDVRNYCTDKDQERSLQELLTHCNETLIGTLNKHAPLHKKMQNYTDNHGLMIG